MLRYLEIQDALAHDSLEKAKVAAAKLPTAVSKVKVSIGSPAWTAWAPLRDDIDAYGLSISSATSFESARQGFELLSASIRRVLEQFGNPLDKPLKLAHCPMARAARGHLGFSRVMILKTLISVHRCIDAGFSSKKLRLHPIKIDLSTHGR